MKRIFVNLFGKQAYRNYIAFTTDLYHSAFLNLKEAGIRIIPKLIPRGGVVCDIGANIGQFTNLAAKWVGEKGQVIAFEPGSESRKVLSTMIRLKRLHHVTVIDKALSNNNTKQRMAIPLKEGWKPMLGLAHLAGADRSIDDANTMYETVMLTRLDDFCGQHHISSVDFIKCDTEGAELNVFRGAREVLTHSKPSVFCEIEKNHCDRYGIDPSDIFDLFRGLDYVAFLPMENDKGVTRVAGYVKRANYFFFHQSKIGELRNKILISDL